jgi:hypothetical protein
MPVVADSEAVSFIAEHGCSLYVYADAGGLKHVKTERPSDPSLHFEQIEAEGFLMYVDDDIEHPQTWNVRFHHLP